LARLERRASFVPGSFKHYGEQLISHDRQLESLTSRLSVLESSQPNNPAREPCSHFASDRDEQIATLEQEIEILTARLSVIESAQLTNPAREPYRHFPSHQDEQIASLEGQIEILAARLSAIESRADELERLSKWLSRQQTQIGDLVDRLSVSEQSVSARLSVLIPLDDSVDRLSVRLSGLERTLTDHRLGDLKREFADLEREFADLSVAVKTMSGATRAEIERLRVALQEIQGTARNQIYTQKQDLAELSIALKAMVGESFSEARAEIEELRTSVHEIQGTTATNQIYVQKVFSGYQTLREDVDNMRRSDAGTSSLRRSTLTPTKPPKVLRSVECPMKDPRLLNGIIAYLTKKHTKMFSKVDLVEKGVISVTSKSVFSDNPWNQVKNVLDLASDLFFQSKDEPNQWVCWDFRDARVQITNFTIRSSWLKSWIVEASLDGTTWARIDKQTCSREFESWNTASFAALGAVECRYVRITQTAVNWNDENFLCLKAFEIFGTILE
jgi:hypothetical protein